MKETMARRITGLIISVLMMLQLVANANLFASYSYAADNNSSNNASDFLESVYYIRDVKSGKVLDVSSNSYDNGAKLVIWDQNYGNNQKFKFEKQSEGYYKITALHTGKSIEVQSSSKANNAIVQQWDDLNMLTKRWYIEANADGTYSFRNANSGKYLCVKGNGTEGYTDIVQYQSGGLTSNKFKLEMASSTGSLTEEEIRSGDYSTHYISELAVAGDNSPDKAKEALYSRGYTVIDKDLNEGCGKKTDYIYLGYKTTLDHSEAIKNVKFRSDWENRFDFTDNGLDYHIAPAYGKQDFIDHYGNLNNSVKYSRCVFLFYSKQNDENHDAITRLYINDNKKNSIDGIDMNLDEIGDHYGVANDWKYLYLHAEYEQFPFYVENNLGDFLESVYYIRDVKSGKVLDVSSHSYDNGAKLVIWDQNYGNNQKFKFEKQPEGHFKITALHTGKSIEVQNSSKENNASVQQWDDLNMLTKRWYIEKNEDGTYSFRNAMSGKYLTVKGNGTAGYTEIVQYQSDENASNKFKLELASSTGSLTEDELKYLDYSTHYISELALAGENSAEKAKKVLQSKGYTVIDTDLNAGCGEKTDYIYLGYKTTLDPSEAIKNLKLKLDWENRFDFSENGLDYKRVAAFGKQDFIDHYGNLNNSVKDSRCVFLFYSKQEDENHDAITRLYIDDENGYSISGIDMNKGAGYLTDDLYLHAEWNQYPLVNGKYISDIMLAGYPSSKNDLEIRNTITAQGYRVINYNLNKGASGEPYKIYLGYKTTNDYAEAIKDICIMEGDSYKKESFSQNDKNYNICTRFGDTGFKNNYANLNYGNSGKHLYLFYTKDFTIEEYSSKYAVSGVSINAASMGAVSDIDLNKGSGGSSIYLHYDTIGFKTTSDIDGDNIDSAEWMRYLPDGLSIANINIPGTHDSGSYNTTCFPAIEIWTEVQHLPIGNQEYKESYFFATNEMKVEKGQLESGVRFVDLRFEYKDGKLVLSHGGFTCRYTYELSRTGWERRNDTTIEVAYNYLKNFLKAHPSETVLVSIQEEGGGEKTKEEVYNFFKKRANEPGSIIWSGTNIPTLGEARGKIVLMSTDMHNKKYDFNMPNSEGKWCLLLSGAQGDVENETLGCVYRDQSRNYVQYSQNRWDNDTTCATLQPVTKAVFVYNSLYDASHYRYIEWEKGNDILVTNYFSANDPPFGVPMDYNIMTRIVFDSFRMVNKGRFFGIVAIDYATESYVRDIYSTNFGRDLIDEIRQQPHVHKLEKSEQVDPTYTTEGCEEFYTCKVCGQLFSDSEGTNPILSPAVIPKLTLEFGEPTYEWSDGNALCTATARAIRNDKNDYVLSDSSDNKLFLDSVSILANNDTPVDEDDIFVETETSVAQRMVLEEPTCTKEGWLQIYVWFTNPKFDEQIIDEAIPAKGHTWGNWEIVTPATDDTEGLERRICTVCGEEETRAIPVTGHEHNLEWREGKEPTCMTCGEEGHYQCTECGKVFSDSEGKNEIRSKLSIPALEHNWGPVHYIYAANYDPDDRTTEICKIVVVVHSCLNCGAEDAAAIPLREKTVITAPDCIHSGKSEFCIMWDDLYSSGNTEYFEDPEYAWWARENGDPNGALSTFDCIRITAPTGVHDYGEPVYRWNDDHTVACAEMTCKVCGHIHSETVNATSVVSKQPADLILGEHTYTAKFENPAFETQEITIADIQWENDITPEVLPKFSVSASAPENVKISIEGIDITNSSAEFEYGSINNMKIETDNNVNIGAIKVNGEDITAFVENDSYTLLPIDADITIEVAANDELEAEYDDGERILIQGGVRGMGRIEGSTDGSEPVFDDNFPMQSLYYNLIQGESVIFSAKADEGYKFIAWEERATGKVFSKEASITLKAKIPLDLVAVFDTEDAVEHKLTDEQLMQWTAKDYKDKTGTDANTAITGWSNDEYEITLTDDEGNILDTYTVNPDTGIGTNDAGEEVDLPQTGMSGAHKALGGLAVLMMLTGVILVKKSRKEDEE